MSKIRIDVSSTERKKLILNELNSVGFSNYYMRIFDKDCDIDVRTALLLKFIGMNPSKPGNAYTREAMKILMNLGNNKFISMFELYAQVAKEFEVTDLIVERMIRRSKEQMLEFLNPKIKILIFGNILDSKTNRIKNSAFLKSLVCFMSSFEM